MKALQDKTIFHTQVHFMRALQRVADSLLIVKKGVSISNQDQHEEGEVIQLFKALYGETSLQMLPEEVLAALSQATFWTQLCGNQQHPVSSGGQNQHLSMYTAYVGVKANHTMIICNI